MIYIDTGILLNRGIKNKTSALSLEIHIMFLIEVYLKLHIHKKWIYMVWNKEYMNIFLSEPWFTHKTWHTYKWIQMKQRFYFLRAYQRQRFSNIRNPGKSCWGWNWKTPDVALCLLSAIPFSLKTLLCCCTYLRRYRGRKVDWFEGQFK